MKKTLSVEELKRFTSGVLTKIGLSEKDADVLTDTMVMADLRGVKSHGVVRLATYSERVEKGLINLSEEIGMLMDENAVGLLDAKNGFGQIAGHRAMESAMEKAKKFGIGMVGVRNSNHFGITAYYSMMALEKGMVGIVMTNASPAMAPFGTTKPLLGTNPVSIAVPAGKHKPIVLDMSMSMVARGKIRYAELTGEKIPEGWGLDKDGNPTTDPKEALEGSLVPIGGVKGSALSLIVDILCGILTESCMTGEVKTVTDMTGPAKTGHIFMAIDIAKFLGTDAFGAKVDEVIDMIKALPPKWDGGIFMAGEIEYNLTEERKTKGIEFEEEVIQRLNDVAKKYGAEPLRF